jgi:uncharacterized protein YndB with AHSA1/START domain
LVALVDGTVHNGERWGEYYERYIDELGSDGTFSREGEAAVLRFERLLNRPVGEVWDALTRPARLRDWLADVSIDAVGGGQVELRFGSPPRYFVTGEVTQIDPPKVLEHTWTSPGGPDRVVKWQLIPVGDRGILLLTHAARGHWDEAGTLAAWHLHLAFLATCLAGWPASPFPEVRWKELHERYAPGTN